MVWYAGASPSWGCLGYTSFLFAPAVPLRAQPLLTVKDIGVGTIPLIVEKDREKKGNEINMIFPKCDQNPFKQLLRQFSRLYQL